jgi:hypothetical protein
MTSAVSSKSSDRTFRPGLNAKTVNNYVTALRRAMDMAVADHALEGNLVRHVRYQR